MREQRCKKMKGGCAIALRDNYGASAVDTVKEMDGFNIVMWLLRHPKVLVIVILAIVILGVVISQSGLVTP